MSPDEKVQKRPPPQTLPEKPKLQMQQSGFTEKEGRQLTNGVLITVAVCVVLFAVSLFK